MRFTIREKLISGYLIIVLLMCILTLYAVNIGQRYLEETVGKDSIFLAEEIIKRIDRDIAHRIEQIQTYAKDMAEEPEVNLSWIIVPRDVTTPFMREIIDNELSDEIREEVQLKNFYEGKYGYIVFGEIFVTNKYGANIAQT